jgi:tetratricopeptide (TPR) repeat protein
MKIKQILITGTLLFSVVSFAQKDELKALKKIYGKDEPSADDVLNYKTNLSKLESVATEEGDKVFLNYYKGILPQIEMAVGGKTPDMAMMQKLFTPKAISEMVNAYTSTLDYENKTGKKVFTDDINEDITAVKPMLLNAAIRMGEAKMYKDASQVLYSIYQLDKKDAEKLYYAAGYAVNAEDYTKALDYYNELKVINFSGEGTLYYAVNKQTKQEESFNTKDQRDLFLKTQTHEKPRDEKIPSKRGEIYKNIALILVHQGKANEAKTAISDARKANPSDTSLLLTEADIYLKEKDYSSYSKVVNEALEKEPNNVDLVYNLGVISAESNNYADAEKYYKRAIQIDANYFNAYLNLAELKLRSDKGLVEEMNKLGNSDKDNKKFEELRAKQLANYREVLPLLEKSVEINPENDAAKKTLLGVYKALEMTDKVKELKSKM